VSSDPADLRGRTHVSNEEHSLGTTRANQPGNGPTVGTPVKLTGGIASAVDPATVRQPESDAKPLMLLEMGKRLYTRFVRMIGGEAAVETQLQRHLGVHIYLDAGGIRVHYRGRVWWVPESNAEQFAAIVCESGTLDEIMQGMPTVAAPQVRYG